MSITSTPAAAKPAPTPAPPAFQLENINVRETRSRLIGGHETKMRASWGSEPGDTQARRSDVTWVAGLPMPGWSGRFWAGKEVTPSQALTDAVVASGILKLDPTKYKYSPVGDGVAITINITSKPDVWLFAPKGQVPKEMTSVVDAMKAYTKSLEGGRKLQLGDIYDGS